MRMRLTSEFSFILIVAACPAGFVFAFAKRISEIPGKKSQYQGSGHRNEDEINRLTSEFSFILIVAACPAGFAFAFS